MAPGLFRPAQREANDGSVLTGHKSRSALHQFQLTDVTGRGWLINKRRFVAKIDLQPAFLYSDNRYRRHQKTHPGICRYRIVKGENISLIWGTHDSLSHTKNTLAQIVCIFFLPQYKRRTGAIVFVFVVVIFIVLFIVVTSS